MDWIGFGRKNGPMPDSGTDRARAVPENGRDLVVFVSHRHKNTITRQCTELLKGCVNYDDEDEDVRKRTPVNNSG